MGEARGMDEAVEADWRGFRGRLADRLERLDDDDWLRIEAEASEGTTPFVQFAAFGDTIRAEAAGGALDAHWTLPHHLQPRLDIRWDPPTAVEPYLYVERPRREVDRLAAESVGVLRNLLGVVHPSFLHAGGLEVDPELRVPAAREEIEDFDVSDVHDETPTYPMSRDHLRDLVDGALRGLLRVDEVQWDQDDDAPIRCGESLAFVRVRSDRPAVEVFAEIVLGAADSDRLSMELELLNQSHPYAKFFVRGEAVVMSHVLHTLPFVPHQFRLMTEGFLDEVDEVARALATRLDARRFFDLEPEPLPVPTLADLYPGLAMMLELMRDQHLTSSRMAALFDHDQHSVLEAIGVVRDQQVDLGDEDPDLVLALLRKGLRVIVDAEAARHRRRTSLPSKRRSRQEPLLSDSDVGIDSLDLGRSA